MKVPRANINKIRKGILSFKYTSPSTFEMTQLLKYSHFLSIGQCKIDYMATEGLMYFTIKCKK